MSASHRLIGMTLFVAILVSACAPAAIATPDGQAVQPTGTPVQPTPALAIREVVDAERLDPILETFLGFNPAYQDPRVDCAAMAGDGVVLGDTGRITGDIVGPAVDTGEWEALG